jgi:hypothetical protein
LAIIPLWRMAWLGRFFSSFLWFLHLFYKESKVILLLNLFKAVLIKFHYQILNFYTRHIDNTTFMENGIIGWVFLPSFVCCNRRYWLDNFCVRMINAHTIHIENTNFMETG